MPLLFVMLGAILLQLVISLLNSVYLLKIQGKFAIVANASFLWHVLRLPMEFFSQRMAGDITNRQGSNQDIAATLIQKLAPQLLNAVMLIFYLVVMMRYSLLLTAVGVATVLINVFVARIISQKRVGISRVQARDAGKLAGMTVQGIDMIETLKASGAESGFFETWSGYQASVNTSSVQFTKNNQYLGAIPAALQQLSTIIVLALGVYLIMNGAFTVGMLLAFQGFMTAFVAPANSLLEAGQSIQEMRTSMERIDDVMSYPTDVEYKPMDPDQNYTKLKGCVEMKNVTFGYSRLGKPLIEDFSMSLKTGSRVAFVGTSGCGKSTLTKLISGLYKPWSGEITFDGLHHSEIPREVFTGSVAVVDQNIIMFEDTIRRPISSCGTNGSRILK